METVWLTAEGKFIVVKKQELCPGTWLYTYDTGERVAWVHVALPKAKYLGPL